MQEHELGKEKKWEEKLTKEIKSRWDWAKDTEKVK